MSRNTNRLSLACKTYFLSRLEGKLKDGFRVNNFKDLCSICLFPDEQKVLGVDSTQSKLFCFDLISKSKTSITLPTKTPCCVAARRIVTNTETDENQPPKLLADNAVFVCVADKTVSRVYFARIAEWTNKPPKDVVWKQIDVRATSMDVSTSGYLCVLGQPSSHGNSLRIINLRQAGKDKSLSMKATKVVCLDAPYNELWFACSGLNQDMSIHTYTQGSDPQRVVTFDGTQQNNLYDIRSVKTDELVLLFTGSSGSTVLSTGDAKLELAKLKLKSPDNLVVVHKEATQLVAKQVGLNAYVTLEDTKWTLNFEHAIKLDKPCQDLTSFDFNARDKTFGVCNHRLVRCVENISSDDDPALKVVDVTTKTADNSVTQAKGKPIKLLIDTVDTVEIRNTQNSDDEFDEVVIYSRYLFLTSNKAQTCYLAEPTETNAIVKASLSGIRATCVATLGHVVYLATNAHIFKVNFDVNDTPPKCSMSHEDILAIPNVTCMCIQDETTLWFAQNSTIYKLDLKSRKASSMVFDIANPKSLVCISHAMNNGYRDTLMVGSFGADKQIISVAVSQPLVRLGNDASTMPVANPSEGGQYYDSYPDQSYVDEDNVSETGYQRFDTHHDPLLSGTDVYSDGIQSGDATNHTHNSRRRGQSMPEKSPNIRSRVPPVGLTPQHSTQENKEQPAPVAAQAVAAKAAKAERVAQAVERAAAVLLASPTYEDLAKKYPRGWFEFNNNHTDASIARTGPGLGEGGGGGQVDGDRKPGAQGAQGEAAAPPVANAFKIARRAHVVNHLFGRDASTVLQRTREPKRGKKNKRYAFEEVVAGAAQEVGVGANADEAEAAAIATEAAEAAEREKAASKTVAERGEGGVNEVLGQVTPNNSEQRDGDTMGDYVPEGNVEERVEGAVAYTDLANKYPRGWFRFNHNHTDTSGGEGGGGGEVDGDRNVEGKSGWGVGHRPRSEDGVAAAGAEGNVEVGDRNDAAVAVQTNAGGAEETAAAAAAEKERAATVAAKAAQAVAVGVEGAAEAAAAKRAEEEAQAVTAAMGVKGAPEGVVVAATGVKGAEEAVEDAAEEGLELLEKSKQLKPLKGLDQFEEEVLTQQAEPGDEAHVAGNGNVDHGVGRKSEQASDERFVVAPGTQAEEDADQVEEVGAEGDVAIEEEEDVANEEEENAATGSEADAATGAEADVMRAAQAVAVTATTAAGAAETIKKLQGRYPRGWFNWEKAPDTTNEDFSNDDDDDDDDDSNNNTTNNHRALLPFLGSMIPRVPFV
jgi:hypothetical protein